MPKKPTKTKGAPKGAPDHSEVKKIENEWGGLDAFLSIYSEATKNAAGRLVADTRMSVYWGSGFVSKDFEEAIHIFELAHSRMPWDGLSAREQADWIKQFDKTVSKLLELLRVAPRPPEDWGFPVRDYVLAEAAQRMGLDLPEASEDLGLLKAGIRLEPLVDAMNWTLADSLRHYQRQQHTDAVVGQTLAKPRDAKAARAYFLNRFQAIRPCVSSTIVATVTGVMFCEEVDERTVRQHRPEGLLRKTKNPS